MNIFSLLGIILDDVVNGNGDGFYFLKMRNDDGTVSIATTSVGINVNDYLPYVPNGKEVIFNFGYNSKYNNRGCLNSITVVTSDNVEATYKMEEKMISELSVYGFDEIYFSICEEIIL